MPPNQKRPSRILEGLYKNFESIRRRLFNKELDHPKNSLYRARPMSVPPLPSLVFTLLSICDDAVFAIASSGTLDREILQSLAKRRAPALAAVARGAPPESMGQGDAWLARLSVAFMPVLTPKWLPMGDLIEEGLSLLHGARGMRSLFTSKPSEKDMARVKAIGAFAVRAMGTILGAGDSKLSDEANVYRRCFSVCLGLPDEDTQGWLTEPVAKVDALTLPEEMDPKTTRAVLRGGFLGAMLDGSDAKAEQTVLMLGRRTGLPAEELTAAHGDARKWLEGLRDFGAAASDGLRFMLEGESVDLACVGAVVARLLLPMPERREAMEAAKEGEAAVLVKRHTVDKKTRAAVLGLVWAAALRNNPSVVRMVELSEKHDRLAEDLGDVGAGKAARELLEGVLYGQLREALPLVPGPALPGGESGVPLLPAPTSVPALPGPSGGKR